MATEGEDSCGICAACRDRRVGPVELLEKYWFFHNTLHGVGVYDFSIEDSCTKNSLEMEVKDSNEAPVSIFDVGSVAPVDDGSTTFPDTGDSPGEKRFDNSKLLRAPSLPPYIGKIESGRGEDRRHKPRETRLERNIGGSVSASSIVPTQTDGSLFLNHKLHRAPSLPPDIGWKSAAQGGGGERESRREPRKTRTQQKERSLSASAAFPKEETETQYVSRTNLVRAASLRPAVVKEEEAEEEKSSDKTRESSRLQRSMSSSLEAMQLFMPPGYRSYSSKTSKVPIMPRDRLPTKPNRQKSLNELEIEELQGFKDLGFTFDREDINPSILNVIPGLQENRPIDEERVRRPYLSEAWSVQRPNPPSLNWDRLNSRSVDMKEQLKVWARTVASNVGQKC